MIDPDKRRLLHEYLEQGTTKSEAARKLGISRDTVHRWIRQGRLTTDGDGARRRRGVTKLEPYKPAVVARIRADPGVTVTALLAEIRDAGYGGGYTILKEYVRSIRPEGRARERRDQARPAVADFNRFRFS